MRKIMLWSMLTALVLVLAACGAKNTGNASTSGSGVEDPATAASAQVEIKAATWKFDQAEYKIKKGVPTKISVINESGMHGVEIPDLNIKLEGGQSQVVTINDAGTYELHCFIPCGTGHTDMTAKLVVE